MYVVRIQTLLLKCAATSAERQAVKLLCLMSQNVFNRHSETVWFRLLVDFVVIKLLLDVTRTDTLVPSRCQHSVNVTVLVFVQYCRYRGHSKLTIDMSLFFPYNATLRTTNPVKIW